MPLILNRTLAFGLISFVLVNRAIAAETNKLNVLFLISGDLRAEPGSLVKSFRYAGPEAGAPNPNHAP